jgi:hypothetical protein
MQRRAGAAAEGIAVVRIDKQYQFVTDRDRASLPGHHGAKWPSLQAYLFAGRSRSSAQQRTGGHRDPLPLPLRKWGRPLVFLREVR